MHNEVRTADLADAHSAIVTFCCTQFRRFGAHARFRGEIVTLRVRGDHGLIKAEVSTAGAGRVLVVDGGPLLCAALLGDDIAGSAVAQGWAGIIVRGAVRDSVALGELPIGLLALGTNPARSSNDGAGERDVPLRFGGATFVPGAYVYADEDGLLISPEQLPPCL